MIEMKETPGTIRDVYTVRENSDKIEGRGHTIRTRHFFSKVLAKDWAKGRGAMGTDEHVSTTKIIRGSDARWYRLAGEFTGKIADEGKIMEVLKKLTPEERQTIRDYLD